MKGKGKGKRGNAKASGYKRFKTKYRSKIKPSNTMLTSKGYVALWRRVPEIYVTNSATPGAVALTDPVNCLQIGTPTATQFGSYDVPFSMVFKISQLINYTDLLNLCDMYKIKAVVVKVYFNSNTNSVNSSATLPQITYISDHDDATVPTTVSSLREKSGAKYKFFNSKNYVKIVMRPRVSNLVFNTGVTTAYSPANKAQWIDSQYINTEHYAIKGILNNVSLPTNSGGIQVGFKFDVNVLVAGKDFQ